MRRSDDDEVKDVAIATNGMSAGRRSRWLALTAVLLCAVVGVGAALFDHWNPQTLASQSVPPERLESLVGTPEDAQAQAVPSVAAADALALNASAPFVKGSIVPSPQFRFSGTPLDRQRAIDCLALAAMAEAGSGDEGQRAVMQVVLNRVRHPAFAKTICGVVFQGSERETGCQFSFTCDGALARRYGDGAWAEARRRANEAISGFVLRKLGTATHYHTDWVYPYWSPSLDKVAKIDTHLFFRWKGYWGDPKSFSATYRGGENSLDELKGAARPIEPLPTKDDIVAPAGDSLTLETPSGASIIKHPDGGAFLVSFASRLGAAQALATARRLCGGNGYCRVMGWVDRSALPKGFPINPASRAKMSFSYVIDDTNKESVQYDCRLFIGTGADSCLTMNAVPIE